MKHWSIEWPHETVQRRVLRMPPTAVLALLFAALILAGTLLLMLPWATTTPVSWMEAVFTATSAVTVTGLGVVDTGTVFTRFGQSVLLLLIQLGGLGIITFAVLVLSLLGQRLGIRQQMLLREDLNQTSLGDLLRLVRVIAVVVLATELAGTLLLAVRFVPLFGWGDGLFQALFHAVSAFNNAGFSLFPDSLVRFAADPWVNFVIALLIVLGGLGFSVIDEVRNRHNWKYLSLHTRLTLIGTAALLLWALVSFALLEWDNPRTLGGFKGAGDRLLVSAFQAVTIRTAGFNSIDMAALHDDTVLMFMTQMFIGGGSTSTAGGIKVSSFMVLCIATVAFLRGSMSPDVFGRSLAPSDILKVLALVFIGILVTMIGAFLLSITQAQPFLDLMFETVSAFATVGLSRGITGELDGAGRAILIVLMFIGRIGPLALGFAFARGTPAVVRYPQGRVYLG